ncbi:hypothetical protein [Rhodoferax ferrireducens]|nr:hypothetical protein [Rhodoferax ferrireducens]
MTQLPLQLPLTLEQMCMDAQKRLKAFVNRSAGQHIRAMNAATKSSKAAI